MKKSQVLIGVLLVILTTGVAAGLYGWRNITMSREVDTADWKRYEAPGLSFKYPSTARIQMEKRYDDPVAVGGDTRAQAGSFRVSILEEDVFSLRVNNTQNHLERGEAGEYADRDDMGFQEVQFKGKVAYQAYSMADCSDCGLVLSIKHRNDVYNFNFNLAPDDPITRAILNSIEFREGSQATT